MLPYYLLSLLTWFQNPDTCYTRCGDDTPCLCNCIYEQGQQLRADGKYAEAVKNFQAVQSLCPDKGAQAIIDSIYQTYRIWVYKDGAFAVATPLGEPLSAFEYYNPQPFNKYGIAICENNNGRYFFVDAHGKQLNELPGYEGIILAEGGLYIIKNVNINDSTYYVVSPQKPKPVFQAIDRLPNQLEKIGKDLQILEWAQFIEKISSFESADNFVDGIARVKKDGKWGYWSKAGGFLFEPQFEDADNFVDGIALVQKNGKTGLIDSLGLLVPTVLDSYHWLYEKTIALYANGRRGLLYVKERSYIPCEYEEIAGARDEWVRVMKNGKWGWVDHSGKTMIPCRYDAATPFDAEGKAWVYQFGERFRINKEGLMVWEK